MIQNDGKIVVVGYTANANDANQNFAVARLNADGSIDTTFSGDGRQITNFGGNDFAMSVALQPNGKMVVAGYKSTSPTMAYVALARYNPGAHRIPRSRARVKRYLALSPTSLPLPMMCLSNRMGKLY